MMAEKNFHNKENQAQYRVGDGYKEYSICLARVAQLGDLSKFLLSADFDEETNQFFMASSPRPLPQAERKATANILLLLW